MQDGNTMGWFNVPEAEDFVVVVTDDDDPFGFVAVVANFVVVDVTECVRCLVEVVETFVQFLLSKAIFGGLGPKMGCS